MASDETWEQLATTALLGTERSGEELAPAMREAVGFTPTTREQGLLATATAYEMYRRAGALAEEFKDEMTAAPAETLRAVSAKADEQLRVMLEGTYDDALPEWLAACAAAKKRVRERSLPALLALAVKQRALRGAIAQVIGERGKWLLGLNAPWQKAFAPLPADAWETGTKEQRLLYLRELRHSDATAARALLEKTWPQEGPAEREQFMAELAQGLSMADEPFLEAALDDKRKEVRDAAAELLMTLPESRLMQRMVVRIAPRITVKRKMLGKAALEITLPAEHTKEMQRDGISAKAPRSTLGEKAWWLAQLVAATPLAQWELPPDPMLAAVMKTEFVQALLFGLSAAAARQRNAVWSKAMLAALATMGGEELTEGEGYVPRLLAALPPADVEAIAAEAMADARGKRGWDARNHLLLVMKHPWSLDFSRTVVAGLAAEVGRKNAPQDEYTMAGFFQKEIAYHMHPAVAPEMAPFFPSDRTDWMGRAIEKFIATLQFRHDMLKELAQ